jgi:heme-degrading monooxygenase HmoA
MFVAINYIECDEHYRQRFEELFATRAGAIDRMPGFRNLRVLRQAEGDGPYLIMSEWDNAEDFERWKGSPEFVEGHKRGFEDMRRYREEGKPVPLRSDFKIYEVIAN